MIRALLWLALAGPPSASDPARIDLDRVRAGIAVRVGDAAEGWGIAVLEEAPTRVRVALTPPDDPPFERDVTLAGDDPQARVRQLAAAIALVIQTHEAAVEPADREPPPVEAPAGLRPEPAGWLGLGPEVRTNFARNAGLEGGLGLAGGAWLASQHVHPHVEVGWGRSAEGPLRVDAVRVVAGLGFGAGLAGQRLWLGAAARGGLVRAFARDRSLATATSGVLGVVAMLQLRWRALLVGLDFGPQWLLPSLRFEGAASSFRWRATRLSVGLRVGIAFQKRPKLE